jgi:hypothetical protein
MVAPNLKSEVDHFGVIKVTAEEPQERGVLFRQALVEMGLQRKFLEDTTHELLVLQDNGGGDPHHNFLFRKVE